MTQPKHVLVVKTSSMGDVIHTLPALTDAANALPGIRFDWVVEEGFADIPTWHPAVAQVIPVAIRRWRKTPLQAWKSGQLQEFRQRIGDWRYDAVIDAQGLLKSALLTKMAQGPRFGLDWHSAREPLASRFYTHPKMVPREQHAVERVRQLFAQSLGYPLPKSHGQFLLDKDQFPKGQITDTPYVMFIHGTTWPTKHWPENYWCELARKVNQAGLHVVLPWGNDQERARAERIAKSSQATVLPKLSLTEVAGVICQAKAAVAVDTGLGHLTAALEIPALSLYGPTSPLKVGAYGANQKYLTLKQCPDGNFPPADPKIFTPMTPGVVWHELAGMLKA